jgi:hypothetical protein
MATADPNPPHLVRPLPKAPCVKLRLADAPPRRRRGDAPAVSSVHDIDWRPPAVCGVNELLESQGAPARRRLTAVRYVSVVMLVVALGLSLHVATQAQRESARTHAMQRGQSNLVSAPATVVTERREERRP